MLKVKIYCMILLGTFGLCHCIDKRETIFRKQTNTSVSASLDIPYHTVASEIDCARSCLTDNNCIGVTFCETNRCTLLNDIVTSVAVPDPACVVYGVSSDQATTTAPMLCQNGGTPASPCDCPAGTTGSYCETRILDCKDVAVYVSTSPDNYTVWPTNSATSFDIECTDFTDYGTLMMFRHSTKVGCTSTPVTYLGVPWADYKNGFSHENCYMWLGLEKIYAITTSRPYKLLMDIVNPYGEDTVATYSSFSIGDESSEYRLSVSQFSAQGNIGDRFDLNDPARTMDGVNFCTTDRCVTSDQVCGESQEGGWWYRQDYCQSNPHQQWGIEWETAAETTSTMQNIVMWLVPA